MAIKIIKNTLEDDILMTCHECGSEFSFNYTDIRRDESTSILGNRVVNRYVICPVCKHGCDIPSFKKKEAK